MKRQVCGALIRDNLGPEDIVVCSLGSVNRTWREIGAPQAAYFCSDPMGIALCIGLGLALARPDRKIAMLCGDGELLMSLSSLVTIAGVAPANLKIVVFNNARYETGGSQPLPNPATSFAAIARGAGFAWAEETGDEARAAALTNALFTLPGLGLLSLATDRDVFTYGAAINLSQAEERALFMQRLARSADPK